MKWFEELLTDIDTEVAKTLTEKFNKAFPLNAVPKDQYSKKTDEIKTLTDELETVNTNLANMSKDTQTAEEYKIELDKLKGDYDTFKGNSEKREKEAVMKQKLIKNLSTKFAGDSIDLLVGEYKLDELTLNEAGEIVDIESKMLKQAESRPSLVISTSTTTPPNNDGQTKPTDVDTSKLSDAEYFAAQAAKKE